MMFIRAMWIGASIDELRKNHKQQLIWLKVALPNTPKYLVQDHLSEVDWIRKGLVPIELYYTRTYSTRFQSDSDLTTGVIIKKI